MSDLTAVTDDDIMLCEICVEREYASPDPATTQEQDEHGNTLWVCETHAEELAACKPERAADQHYDEMKDLH
jgi:hypothetical protein